MPSNILEEGFAFVVECIQKYGWYAVFTAIGLYFSWPQIQAYRNALSLADANNPQRRSILEAQRLRVRLQQQKSLEGEADDDSKDS